MRVALLLTVLAAQAAAPAFEVATIRLSPPEAQGALINFPQPGRLSVTNFTLRMLIGQAYQSEMGPGFQVTGGPSWIEKDRYVILGQAQGTTPRAEMMSTMKQLLDWSKLEPMYTRVYQKTFTQQEVDGMLAFYKTPAGQAVLSKMPTVMQNTMDEMQQLMGPVMQKIQKMQEDVVAQMKSEEKKKGG